MVKFIKISDTVKKNFISKLIKKFCYNLNVIGVSKTLK